MSASTRLLKITLPNGLEVILGPGPEVADWQRHLATRKQDTTASPTRALRRRLERELRRQARRDKQDT